MIESNTLLIDVIGADGKVLSIKDLETPIEFNVPYSGDIRSGRNPEFLSCSWYDENHVELKNVSYDEVVPISTTTSTSSTANGTNTTNSTSNSSTTTN